jgi:transcriptional regulator with XRE-family HTH domain
LSVIRRVTSIEARRAVARKKGTSDALEILRRRYVKDDPGREAALEDERVNAGVARMIYDLRTGAGLSQHELAELIGTSQSVISRLEDADYEGHSLSMLNRIAKALNQRLTVAMSPGGPEAETLRYVFRVLLRDLRRARGLTVDELAQRSGIDKNEIVAMERNSGHRPAPPTLRKLSQFYGIPERRLAALGGAPREVPSQILESASRFAEDCESFARLTGKEKKALDEFVNALKAEDQG